MIYLIISILISIISIYLVVCARRDRNTIQQRNESEWRKEFERKHSDELKKYADESFSLQNQLNERRNSLAAEAQKENEQLKDRLRQDREEYVRDLDRQIEQQKRILTELEQNTQKTKNSIKEKEELVRLQQIEAYQLGLVAYNEMAAEQICDLENQIAEKQIELMDFQLKIDVVNHEILRRRELEEKQDFYRIVISDEAKEDIELLRSIRTQLHNRTNLDKLIYDAYISKSVKEMIKRVLSGDEPSGIYKITNIETNEIYIGKSTNIPNRWQSHVKAALGLDGVADSMFQRALKKYGVDKFTFEVLEEADKSELSECEKYWIDFYDTTTVGYNERKG